MAYGNSTELISLRIARAHSDVDAQKFSENRDQKSRTGIAAASFEGEGETLVNTAGINVF